MHNKSISRVPARVASYHARPAYLFTVINDDRLRGPYLAIAIVLGIQADSKTGKGERLRLAGMVQPAVGVSLNAVKRTIDALEEMGYLEMLGDSRLGEPGPYRIKSDRPGYELTLVREGEMEPEQMSSGPAARWLAEETATWDEFCKQRYHEQDDDWIEVEDA